MEEKDIGRKIPGRKGWWDLLEKASSEWVKERIGKEDFLSGPAQRHPMPELFVSQTDTPLVMLYMTRQGKIRRIENVRIWVDQNIPHQILIPPDTSFEIYTCQQNLEEAENRDRLEDFLRDPRK